MLNESQVATRFKMNETMVTQKCYVTFAIWVLASECSQVKFLLDDTELVKHETQHDCRFRSISN